MVPGGLSRRRVRVLAVLGATVLLTALAGLVWRPVFEGERRPTGPVVFSTGVPSGVYNRYGHLLRAQLARDAPSLQTVLRPSQGSVENIERLVAGAADFAIATADALAAYQAKHGARASRLRACARLYDDYVQLVVPADSPVRSPTNLAGLRVGVGQDGSGVQLVTRGLLAAAGLDVDRDVTPVRQAINTMPRMLEAGDLDAFFWSGGLPTTAVEQLARHLPIRLVPLGDLLPELQAQGPHTAYYRGAVMPPDLYPDVRGSQVTDTVAVANLLVTTDRVDSALVRQVTRSVINGRDRIGQEAHAAQRVDLRTAIYTEPLRLHQGARDYYRSVKP